MYFLYTTLIYLVYSLLFLVAPWHTKVKQWLNGQKQTRRFIKQLHQTNTDNSPLYWFHCASLGEFEQARPLIEEVKKREPTVRVLLTFFSPSGYEIQKNYPLATYVLYLPLDTPLFLLPFIDAFKPTALFLAKYDFWPNLISLLYKKKIPILAFSTVFRPSQIYFKWYGSFFRNTLKKITFLFAQENKTVDLLIQNGISQTAFTGDTRIDRVIQIATNPVILPKLQHIKVPFFVAGSIWEKDFQLIRPLIEQRQDLHFILVPHDINEHQIQRWQQELSPLTVARWSVWHKETTSPLPKVLLIDTIGILSSLYSLSTYTYIGGAWNKGLHNILEAAVYGMPLFFGAKKYRSFVEANQLIDLKAAFPVHNSNDLLICLAQVTYTNQQYNEAAVNARQYVYKQGGATNKVLEIIKNMALIP